jgi:NhaA family Na+:H+ antiporter
MQAFIHTADFLAADGLLSIFFFVIGLELVDEIRNGDLRDYKHASLPALAAIGGVIFPALIFVGIVHFSGIGAEYMHGWAVPTATDVAFSLAILALFGSRLRPGIKLFLMVLAVVDDIIGIVIIALVFSSQINPLALLGVIFCTVIWIVITRQKKIIWPIVFIVAALTWFCMYKSGIHPTIAGVILGISVPARKFDIEEDDIEKRVSRAHVWAGKLSPFNNKFVVPVFAATSIIASGYELVAGMGGEHSGSEAQSPDVLIVLVVAISVALIVGKPFGIILFAWIGAHLTPLNLFHGLRVRNLIGASVLGGIGFTVSFLVAGLSFSNETDIAFARIGVLIGSLASAILGYFVIRLSLRKPRKL